MTPRPRDYHRPATLAEAAAALRKVGATVQPLNFGPHVPLPPFEHADEVLDLARLGLDSISRSNEGLRLGGLVTLEAIAQSPDLKAVAGGVLPEAARLAAHPGLRRLATLGGTIATLAGPPEVRLCLLALAATVVAQGTERREVKLADYRPDPHELIVEVRFAATGGGGALARVARSPLDQAIVAAVAVVTRDSARVAVAGAAPQPMVLSAQGAIDTARLRALADEALAAADPIADYRGSADYRRAMAAALAARALAQAHSQHSGS